MAGDLLEALRRDAGNFRETEISIAELIVPTDEGIGVWQADAGVVLAKLFPSGAEVVGQVGVADLFETLSARRRTTAGDGGERFPEPDPGAPIQVFFPIHGGFRVVRFGNRLRFAARKGVTSVLPIGTNRKQLSLACSQPHSRPNCRARGMAGQGWRGRSLTGWSFVLLGKEKFWRAVTGESGVGGKR
jgi:hypothetical protein